MTAFSRKITRTVIALAFCGTMYSGLAGAGRQVLAGGGPMLSASWTPDWTIQVSGRYFSARTIQIYEYPDGSATSGAVHYTVASMKGTISTSFWQGVCAFSTDTIRAYDPTYGWSNSVVLPSVC